jgi:hypothetical protein
MRTQQNARLCQGDDRTLMIAVSNPSNLNLTGLQAKYIAAAASVGPNTPIITKTVGSGITIITDPASVPVDYALVLKVVLVNDDTDDVPPGWYYHEAQVTLANASTITVMTGQLRVDPSWTNSRL